MRKTPFIWLFAVAVAVLFAGCDSPKGWWGSTLDNELIILHLKGSWFEMGRQYGKYMAMPMWLARDFANRRATDASDRYLLPHGIPCGVDFLDQFFAGVAEGSGLSIQEIIRINGVEVAYGEELVRLFGGGAAGKCSALAMFGEKTKDGGMIFGRNYDWLPSFRHLGLVLTVFHPTDSDMDFAMLNYPGCFYLTSGMNSAGVFVELNSGMFASADTHPEEIHNAWSLWHVLTQARSTDQAVRILDSLPSHSAYIIGIADARKSVSYEWEHSKSAALSSPETVGWLAMTNHFVQPGWRNLPSASEGGLLSSESRLRALRLLAEKIPSRSADVETMKRIISVPVDSGGALWKGTLFQVIAIPQKKTMLIKRRNQDKWDEFSF